jgi:hypothetical protein
MMKRAYSLHLTDTPHPDEVIKNFFLRNGFKLQNEEENKLGFTKENPLWSTLWVPPFIRRIHVIIVRRKQDIYIYSSMEYFWEFLNLRNEKWWDYFFLKLKNECCADPMRVIGET